MEETKSKILIFDLETSFNVLYTFGLTHNDYIPPENIVQERYIFCVSYKWFGESKIHTISILDDKKRFKKDIADDTYVVNEFYKVLEQADALVAHNLVNFDEKMFAGRMLFHGLPPLPKVKKYDTLKMVKKYFRLNSNKLDYVSQYLGHKGKLENPKGLWHDCMKGDVKALKHMAKYNRQDIDALELVFTKLMPYVKDHQLNAGMFLSGARCPNPTCGSTDLQWRGWNYTRTGKFRRCVCKNCGSWADERRSLPNCRPEIK